MPQSLQDRLRLDAPRVAAVADALRDIAALPDPVGEVVRGSTLANGLEIRQVRVPMGVVGMIYEARPNVTVDAAGLGLKSGNAVILRGGSAAAETNRATVAVLRASLGEQGLPPDAVALLEGGHGAVRALMTARGLVDLLIPRGGADLIRTVVTESTVPVIETGVGNCHVYVDAAADLDKALAIAVNSKTQRPSVCNAAESLLVHRAVASALPPQGARGPGRRGGHPPHRRRCRRRRRVRPGWRTTTSPTSSSPRSSTASRCRSASSTTSTPRSSTSAATAPATPRPSSPRTAAAARRFTAEVDAAVVMVNASTRFTDGGEFGFGAEIGISTQKLHARGPMALPELTTTKWVVEGDGQIRV